MHDGVNAMAGAAGLGGPDGAAPVVIRGDLIYLTGDPFAASLGDVFTCIPDGAVLCRGGLIERTGPYAELAGALPPGAEVLGLAGRLGSLEADIVVLDPLATPLIALREARSQEVLETLFVLMAMGDDRAVHSTYVAGRLAHSRDGARDGVGETEAAR